MKRALIIVETPLQLLCGYEAFIREKKEADVILRLTGRGDNDMQLVNMAAALGISYRSFIIRSDFVVRDVLKNFFGLVSLLLVRRDSVYVGSWFSRFLRGCTRMMQKRNIYFMDDGVATLLLHKKMQSSLEAIPLFTFFDMKALPGQTVIKHSFDSLRKKFSVSKVEGSYFVGQPLVERGYIGESEYVSCLESAVLIGGGELFYIPHRVESDDVVNRLRGVEGVIVTRLEESIELFFLKKGFFPKYMFGLSSTSIFTIAQMSPETQLHSFHVNSSSYESIEHLDVIYDAMSRFSNIVLH